MKVVLETTYDKRIKLDIECLFRKTRYSIQQHQEWITGFLKYFLGNKNYYFLCVRGNQNELISCLCLHRNDKSFYKISRFTTLIDLGNGVNDFFNIPCKAGYEKEVASHFANWFVENSSQWEKLQLDFLPKTKMHIAFVESIKKYFPIEVSEGRNFYKIDTDRSWESYFTAEMNKRLRDVRGRMNRITKSGHKVSSRIIDDAIENYLDDFLVHFSKRREDKGEKNSYENDAKVRLIRDLIGSAKKDKSIQLSVLEDSKGKIWAYQLDLMDWNKGIWYHYAPTFNNIYREFSPSKVLLLESIKHAFSNPKIKEFNFMRGEADYKKQFTDNSDSYMAIKVININSRKIKFQQWIANLIGK